MRLHKADGTELRVHRRERTSPRWASTASSQPEFLQVKTRDGFVMEAMLIKPPDFDPTRRYPVYQQHLRRAARAAVRNALGRHGNHVPPAARAAAASSSGCATTARRAARAPSRRGPPTSGSGETELADIEDGLAWLKHAAVGRPRAHRHQRLELRRLHDQLRADAQHELRDGHRRRHRSPTGATTTSIYTERYMLMPQNNPEGYERDVADERREGPARQAAAHPRDDRRQRAPAEHDAVRLRAAEGRQAVRADALPEVAARRHRSAAREAHARRRCSNLRFGR